MDVTSRHLPIAKTIQKDPFSNYLGAIIEIIKPGHSRVSLTVTDDMANFIGTTHGGVIFTIADMAFGAACNAGGQKAVALNENISFLKPSKPGDRLVAEAKEQETGGRIVSYGITVTEQKSGELLATSQNLAYRTGKRFVTPVERPGQDA
jgi:acyl-CoA thioesterase